MKLLHEYDKKRCTNKYFKVNLVIYTHAINICEICHQFYRYLLLWANYLFLYINRLKIFHNSNIFQSKDTILTIFCRLIYADMVPCWTVCSLCNKNIRSKIVTNMHNISNLPGIIINSLLTLTYYVTIDQVLSCFLKLTFQLESMEQHKMAGVCGKVFYRGWHVCG